MITDVDSLSSIIRLMRDRNLKQVCVPLWHTFPTEEVTSTGNEVALQPLHVQGFYSGVNTEG